MALWHSKLIIYSMDFFSPLLSSVVHLFSLHLPSPSSSLSVKWGGGIRWQRADISSPALKMLVKMEGGKVERVKPVPPWRLGVLRGRPQSHAADTGFVLAASTGNGSSLSNLLLPPQILNGKQTPNLGRAAINFVQENGHWCIILQHIYLIKLNFGCSRGVYSPYLLTELTSSAKTFSFF